jgi:hypothetical protein
MRRMYFACWIPKDADTHLEYVMLSTATVVAWKRLNITLCVSCLSCCIYNSYELQPRSVSLFIHCIFREPHLTVCLVKIFRELVARLKTVANRKHQVGDVSYNESINQSTKNGRYSVLCLLLQLNWACSVWSHTGHFLCPIQPRCHSSMQCDVSVALHLCWFSFVVSRMRKICLRQNSSTDRSVSIWGKT